MTELNGKHSVFGGLKQIFDGKQPCGSVNSELISVLCTGVAHMVNLLV